MIKKILIDEKGTALIVGLVIMVVLTFLGLMVIGTSTTEVMISGNERQTALYFYRAEAGAQVGLGQWVNSYPFIPSNFSTGDYSVGYNYAGRGVLKGYSLDQYQGYNYEIISTAQDSAGNDTAQIDLGVLLFIESINPRE